MTEGKQKIMKTAFRLLSRRPHSRKELINKLTARGHSFSDASAMVKECERLGYINDELFAGDYLKELVARGQGEMKIKMKMWRKGLPKELIEDKLSEFSATSSATERASTVLATKMTALNREADPRKRRDKAYRFLASRGFNSEAIRGAMEELDENN